MSIRIPTPSGWQAGRQLNALRFGVGGERHHGAKRILTSIGYAAGIAVTSKHGDVVLIPSEIISSIAIVSVEDNPATGVIEIVRDGPSPPKMMLASGTIE